MSASPPTQTTDALDEARSATAVPVVITLTPAQARELVGAAHYRIDTGSPLDTKRFSALYGALGIVRTALREAGQ